MNKNQNNPKSAEFRVKTCLRFRLCYKKPSINYMGEGVMVSYSFFMTENYQYTEIYVVL